MSGNKKTADFLWFFLITFLPLLLQGHRNGKTHEKAMNGMKAKEITLLIDTTDDTFIESGVIVPDEHVLEWIYAAAKRKTSERVSNIVVRIRCD